MNQDGNRIVRQVTQANSSGADSATSDLDCTPKEAEQRFVSVKARFERVSDFVAKTRDRIHKLKSKLKKRAEISRIHDELKDRYSLLKEGERERYTFSKVAKAAAYDSFGATFYEVARLALDPKTFEAIADDTRAILGRQAGGGIETHHSKNECSPFTATWHKLPPSSRPARRKSRCRPRRGHVPTMWPSLRPVPIASVLAVDCTKMKKRCCESAASGTAVARWSGPTSAIARSKTKTKQRRL
jgi:hypothetical protein